MRVCVRIFLYNLNNNNSNDISVLDRGLMANTIFRLNSLKTQHCGNASDSVISFQSIHIIEFH